MYMASPYPYPYPQNSKFLGFFSFIFFMLVDYWVCNLFLDLFMWIIGGSENLRRQQAEMSLNHKVLVDTIRAVQPEFQGLANIYNIPRLPQQLVSQAPLNWIPDELVGIGDQKIEITLKSDNLYLAGLKNKPGQWFEL